MPQSTFCRAIGAGLGMFSLVSLLGASSALAQTATFGASGKTIIHTANPSAVRSLSDADIANAKSRLPMLKDLSQVPGLSERIGQGYGSAQHPFTTKGAYSSATTGTPVHMRPWRSAGKLYMVVGGGTYVCTASVIQKGILVTAAHCVQNYGQGTSGSATSVWFKPGLHGTYARYGSWTAAAWIVPSVYSAGNDNCTVSGVVCDNDIALVVMNKGPSPYASKDIAQVVNRFNYYHKELGFTTFLGKQATQITQLGYPVAFDSGLKMIRTDSLGYQASPNNIIIGSDQTGGSSGGPWIVNFGLDPVSTSSTPTDNHTNRVVATTSWGYVSDMIKLQGASRFNNNGAFPAPGNTNIQQLLADVCAAYPTKCN